MEYKEWRDVNLQINKLFAELEIIIMDTSIM